MLTPTTNLVSFSDIKSEPIAGWQDFLQEGNQFLSTAQNAYSKGKQAFTAEVLYNLVAMAIEKFVMAALMRYGTMPYNHTMADLVGAMEETFPGAVEDMKDELLKLDSYPEICDLDGFSITPPGMDKIPAMLDLAGKVKLLVTDRIINEG